MNATGAYRDQLQYFNLVQLSGYSREVLDYEKKKNQYGHGPDPQAETIARLTARKPKPGQSDKQPGMTLLDRMRLSQKPRWEERTDPDATYEKSGS